MRVPARRLLGARPTRLIAATAIRSAFTRPASSSAATKLRSFSRRAMSFATQRSSLSRHQPVKCGSPVWGRRVGVLHLDQAVAPAVGEDGGLEVDAVDAEAVQLLERRELARDAFDQVGQPGGLVVAVGDREDVDLDRHRGRGGELRLVVGAEDRLRADHDHLGLLDDLAGRADRVLQLVAPHQPASFRTSRRCSSGSRPDMGETSRISIESRSRPVRTRCRPGRSPRSTSCRQRSRFRSCGWPVTRSLETVEVALDRRPPVLEALAVEERREPPVQLPGSAFRASQLGDDRASYDLEPEAHARQEPVELVVAEVDATREEAADARLADTAEPGQLGLRGARLEHHLAQHVTPTRHEQTIAVSAMEAVLVRSALGQHWGNTRSRNSPKRPTTANHQLCR